MEKLLIEEVKKRNFLYDARSSYYRDQNRRTQAWREIGRTLQLKPDVAKYTWEKLRRCFSNALQRRKNRKYFVERRERPPWKYETSMSFLLGVSDSKTSVDRTELHKIPANLERNECLIEIEESNVIASQVENSCNYDVSYTQINGLSSSNRREVDNENHQPVIVENIKQEVEDTYNNERLRVNIQNFDENLDSFQQFKLATYTHFQLDETDMFFLSLSKTTKTLHPLKQAKIKLLVSQAVLQTQIAEDETL